MRRLFLITFLVLSSVLLYGQLELSGELRPRFEYDHGQKSPYTNDPSQSISQRTRLNVDFAKDKYRFGLVLQDIRNWGDTRQMNIGDDKDHFGVHEAWGEILFSEVVSLKLGRQELSYDNHRILGNVGWAQQARSHDLALFKVEKGSTKFHAGAAINGGDVDQRGGAELYESMQFLWWHNKLDKFSYSFLLLNNGIEKAEETYYNQTIGTYMTYKPGKLNVEGSFYYQLGEYAKDVDLNAWEAMLQLNFPVGENFTGNVGMEYLSGNDASDEDFGSFTPYYGTNHKFNGWMDYFYVGSGHRNAGLSDMYLGLNYKKNKFSFGVVGHYFNSAEDLVDVTDATVTENYLGTELDFSIGYQYDKDISFKGGYSHMFAGDGMKLAKQQDLVNGFKPDEDGSWAWIMVTIKPTLFRSKK